MEFRTVGLLAGGNQWTQSKKTGQLSKKLSEENTVFLTFLIIHGWSLWSFIM